VTAPHAFVIYVKASNPDSLQSSLSGSQVIYQWYTWKVFYQCHISSCRHCGGSLKPVALVQGRADTVADPLSRWHWSRAGQTLWRIPQPVALLQGRADTVADPTSRWHCSRAGQSMSGSFVHVRYLIAVMLQYAATDSVCTCSISVYTSGYVQGYVHMQVYHDSTSR
jgi:hypothetical protein